jgi:hypothetical protein
MLLAAGVLVAARPAQAQFFYPYQARAATAGESYARGVSDVVRAAGEASLLRSEAAINVEEARSKYLDNRLKGTETYFEMRRRNKEYREAERGPRASSEQLFRLAHENVPSKLSVSELDPVTGEIAWPILLRRDEFEPYRNDLEACYREWANAQGNLSSDLYVRIQGTGNDMLALLKSNVKRYVDMGIPSSDYLAAKNFLRSLLHQSKAGA